MQNKTEKMAARQKKGGSRLIWILYTVLAVLVIAYAIRNSPIIGAAALIAIVAVLIAEFKYSVRSEGMKKSIIDILVALGAVAALWIVLMVVLDTGAPIDVVSSCSMLPVLQRGDLVALHGIGNVSQFVSSNHIPVVNVSATEMSKFLANIENEFVSFYAYNPSNMSEISTTVIGNSTYKVGLYNNKCLDTYSYLGEYYNYYKCRVIQNSQAGNLITYQYGVGRIDIRNQQYGVVYTSAITVANTTIVENYSNPIIVYRTTANDSFTGDIIHRVYAVMRSGENYYFLTKGDNNPGLDIQFVNYPATQNGVVGYYVGGIPVLGYLKLIISGELQGQAQCGQVIVH